MARFAGFETRTIAGITRDYLYLEYQGDDRVFVPTDQLAKISRYVGAGGEHPPLSKLGGSRWETMKARARRAAQQLSGELLSLYAERRRRRGHGFAPDGEWQREFEERFPYSETPDQREAIELVKADMEAPRPMDRLICGDVGYGKTEVALRAAFKAASEGKQVLMLVPTTILALQHYGTFAERLADYPINLEHVSRFRSAAEQRAAVRGFAEGRVDIMIGTQMLAKGHDFPRLTLVGVLGADNSLYSAEYRATERLFALLEQVAGRAGRGACAGEVIIQTDFPDHPLYVALSAHDYDRFAATLLAERQELKLPPFSHLALLRAEAKLPRALSDFLEQAAERGRELSSRHGNRCEVFPPTPATMPRRAGLERAQVLVQSLNRRSLQEFLQQWRAELDRLQERRVRWDLDVDPLSFA